MRNLNVLSIGRLLKPGQILAMLAVVVITLPHYGYAQSQNPVPLPSPGPEYSPEKVIEIVIDALKTNAETEGDEGIATVFRFASPENRAFTGPLDRFTQMIKRGFPDMLDHAGARYEPIEISGDTAIQKVWLYNLNGTEVGYAFQLGRQSGGEYDGFWMTDAVIPLGESPDSGKSI